MSSVLKTTYAADNSALVATDVKNAADVKLATNSNNTNIKAGRASVSDTDLYLKHLIDALLAGAGIQITKNSSGADETLTITAFADNPKIARVDADTIVIGTGAGDTQSLLDLATAGNWIGGASLESANEYVHVYEVMASRGTFKLSDKHPQYSSMATANRLGTAQVNQAGWVGTSGLGLNATSVAYDGGVTMDSAAVGNLALIYSDASYTLGRGRGSAAAGAVTNLSVAKITAVAGGAVSGTLTLEAGHQIALNDDDYIVVIDAGDIRFRYDGSAWYKHIDALWNDSSSDLLDLTIQYGNKRKYNADSYITNEVADYTTASLTFVDVDSTNLTLTINTNGGDILIGFNGTVKNSDTSNLSRVYVDVEVDGVRIGGDDGLALGEDSSALNTSPLVVNYLHVGVPPGTHVFKLQWKVGAGTGTMFNGQLLNRSIHPQFFVREIRD
jgi:hypothetical protein